MSNSELDTFAGVAAGGNLWIRFVQRHSETVRHLGHKKNIAAVGR